MRSLHCWQNIGLRLNFHLLVWIDDWDFSALTQRLYGWAEVVIWSAFCIFVFIDRYGWPHCPVWTLLNLSPTPLPLPSPSCTPWKYFPRSIKQSVKLLLSDSTSNLLHRHYHHYQQHNNSSLPAFSAIHIRRVVDKIYHECRFKWLLYTATCNGGARFAR